MSNFTVLMKKGGNGIVSIAYDGQVDSQEFRLSHLRLLDEFKSLRFNKMLCDFSEMELLEPGDRVWVTTDWFPQAKKAGLTAIACVEPNSTLTDIIIKKPLTEISQHFKVPLHWFVTDVRAIQWLNALHISNRAL